MVEVELLWNGTRVNDGQRFKMPRPQVGDYIECSSTDFWRVKAVLLQPESDLHVLVVTRISINDYPLVVAGLA